MLDKQSICSQWKETIPNEMTKKTKFQVFKTPSDGKEPSGHNKIPCHIIYGVKFDGRHKARFVAGGHLAMDPGEDAHSGVVEPAAV